MFNCYNNVQILAVRAVVPEKSICIEDEVDYYDGNVKKIARLQNTAGMHTRRVCPQGITASDLCAHAAEKLFIDFPQYKDEIDALVFVTQSPDWRQPATACELQHRLGLPKSCAAFDVNQGCSGYVYGLWLAGSLIESGAAKNVLLLAGDVFANNIDPRNRIIAPVFGDAGSATLLKFNANTSPMHMGLGNDGSGYDAIIIPAGAGRIPFTKEHEQNLACVEDIVDADGCIWQLSNTFMDGKRVFSFTMDVVPQHILDVLQYAKCSQKDVSYLILHQANKQIMQSIAIKVDFPLEKVPVESFSKYGNSANASIPTALCEQFGNTSFDLSTPNKALLCGYGIGLSWASCLCLLDNISFAPVIEFSVDGDIASREDNLTYWKNHISNKR